MTEQQACTLCGAGGHAAAQCNWNKAEGAQGEREAFEAHESKERRLSPADQKFWFRRGAVADYDIKSIDDAWKAWKARAALAQPALQCKKCGGTGDADSGGIHPWGEAAMVPCDCAHTERAQGKRTEDGDTIIDRLRLGGLTIDGDNAYKRDLLDCVVGALAFGFQGRPAPEETHWLHRFWEIGNAEREARAALAQPSPAQVYACPECGTGMQVDPSAKPSKAQPSPAPDLERPVDWCLHNEQWRLGFSAAEVQHNRIVQAENARAYMRGMSESGETILELEAERDAAQARVAELERGTVYVEARWCSACGHGGVNDGADGLSACGHCEWTGPQPSKDECPDCLRQNCMSVACPECGGRYELVAEANVAAPVAQAEQVPEGLPDLCRFLAKLYCELDGLRYSTAKLPPEEIADALICKWPVLQGTRNQLNIKRISEQSYDESKLHAAIAAMLAAAPAQGGE